MAKMMKFSDDARQLIAQGVNKLARAVGATMGPRGRNVVIDRGYGTPVIINDGVTIAREIVLTDPFENMGAQLVKEVASKTADVAGDGTTTATVLAAAIYNQGLSGIKAGNPMAIKVGIDEAVKVVVQYLKGISTDVKDHQQTSNVATISANGDRELGNLIADAFEKVGGADGVITVEESRTTETSIELTEGLQFDQGLISPYFVTDPAKMEARFDDAYILVIEKRLAQLKELHPILEKVMKAGRPLLVVAEDVEGEALAFLALNNAKKHVMVAAVKAPAFGARRKSMMEDLVILTGAKFLSSDIGVKLATLELTDLGQAHKVIVTGSKTTVVGGKGKPEKIAERVQFLTTQIAEALDFSQERQDLIDRKGKLAGGVAILRVGATTETELKEKLERVDDALHATRAALQEGIVPGGGVALFSARPSVQKLLDQGNLSVDQQMGAKIVFEALAEPFMIIAGNAGVDAQNEVRNMAAAQAKGSGWGLNAMTGVYEDLVAAGVIDPTKVTRSALQNAASIAALMLTTECLVTEEPTNAAEKFSKILAGQ